MKKQVKAKKMSNKIFSVFFLSTIVILISVYLYQSFQIDLIMKDLHSLQLTKERLMSETETLQGKVDRLSNIDRVSKIAQDKFNLEFSEDKPQVIKIEDGGNLAAIKKKFDKEEDKIHNIKSAGIQ